MTYYTGHPKHFNARENPRVSIAFLREVDLTLDQARTGNIRVDERVFKLQGDREALLLLAPCKVLISFQTYPEALVAVVRIPRPSRTTLNE